MIVACTGDRRMLCATLLRSPCQRQHRKKGSCVPAQPSKNLRRLSDTSVNETSDVVLQCEWLWRIEVLLVSITTPTTDPRPRCGATQLSKLGSRSWKNDYCSSLRHDQRLYLYCSQCVKVARKALGLPTLASPSFGGRAGRSSVCDRFRIWYSNY